jgi:DEAD/DEAH box helicase domain-containing protein
MSRRDRKGLIQAFDDLERAVLISTPAVEVGVDFKADVLITEECDGNGFLQRFGRVGRTGEGRADVQALVREGETWARLQQRHQAQMSREDFSQMIIDPDAPTDPDRSLFPDRTYAAASVYQDATHWLINRQMGRIGQRLNAAMFAEPEVSALARQMEEADVPFAYGLRGTLPGVSLLGGGGGSPFYVLSKVHDQHLAPSSSPFEMAQAQMSYTRFLYTKGYWDIVVDWTRTLDASRAMFYWLDGRWHIATGYGVAKVFFRALDFIDQYFQGDVEAMREQVADVQNPHIQEMVHLGRALELHGTPQARFILGQGDVFLKRVEREGQVRQPVRDRLGNPLVLPDQLWLYLGGDSDKAWRLLQTKRLDQLSEVHYPDREEEALVLLDEVAGGCFTIYERLVQDVD